VAIVALFDESRHILDRNFVDLQRKDGCSQQLRVCSQSPKIIDSVDQSAEEHFSLP
jgi:hypothetical protein